MTPQVPQSQNHVADLLPAYLNGTLDSLSSADVERHLRSCEVCRLELATWKVTRETAQFANASAPLPSALVLTQALAKIDASTAEKATGREAVKRMARHLWLVLKKQVPIIPKSIWIASALVILAGCSIALLSLQHVFGRGLNAELIFSLFTSVTGAAGVAFIYGGEHDAGFEITLSTPTSIRIIMLCRMLLVVGYNIVLSAFGSAIIALVHGAGFWETIQLWLGPLLLLASISLMLSLLIGSAFAVLIALLIEVWQTIPIIFEKGAISLHLANPDFWQTNPAILLLAILFIAFAVFYAPRQPRLS